MTRQLRLTVTLGALVIAFLATTATAHAIPIAACGTTVAAAGTYELVGDLNCAAGNGVSVDADFVNINLAGFTLSGQGTGDIGIEVTPGSDDVLIFGPGTVRGFDTGIQAGDCGLALSGDTDGFAVDGVTVRNSRSYGVALCPLNGEMQLNNSRVINTDGTAIANVGSGSIGGTVSVLSTLVRDSLVGVNLRTVGGGEAVVRATAIEDATSTAVTLGGSGYGEFSDGWIRCPSNACTKGITMTAQDSTSLIARNSIRGVSLAGIEVYAGSCCPISSVVVEDNVVRSVGSSSAIFHGAIVTQERSASVRRNTVRDVSDGPGIHVVCGNAAAIEDNVLRSVGGDGIIMDDDPVPGTVCSGAFGGSNANVVEENLVVNAGGNGVVVPVGIDHQITSNIVGGSALDGFAMGATATGFLTDNRARGNAGDGFDLATGALTLSGNTARRNDGWGFLTVAPVTDLGGNNAVNNTLGDCDTAHLTC